MIELSHFDLSSIITKLNQGVEETSAGHGSDFEKVLTEHLELSGIKSGKPYPRIRPRKIDQDGVSDNIRYRTAVTASLTFPLLTSLSPMKSVCEVCLRPQLQVGSSGWKMYLQIN